VIRAAATDDTNIIFGATIDDRLSGQIWITVVATGLGGAPRRRSLAAAGSSSSDWRSGSALPETPSFLE
jgi:cell division GTPase FtsZ